MVGLAARRSRVSSSSSDPLASTSHSTTSNAMIHGHNDGKDRDSLAAVVVIGADRMRSSCDTTSSRGAPRPTCSSSINPWAQASIQLDHHHDAAYIGDTNQPTNQPTNVEAGLSESKTHKGLVRDITTAADQLYYALWTFFFELHPEFSTQGLYITGESYAGALYHHATMIPCGSLALSRDL